MRKYKDFDQFFAESENKSDVVIKLYGKEYKLPSRIPAKIMLETHKAYKEGVETIPEAQQMEMAMAVLGEDNVNEWCDDHNISLDQLVEIMKWAVSEINNKENTSSKK